MAACHPMRRHDCFLGHFQPCMLGLCLQGRVVTAEFDQFYLVNTYVPNRWVCCVRCTGLRALINMYAGCSLPVFSASPCLGAVGWLLSTLFPSYARSGEGLKRLDYRVQQWDKGEGRCLG